MERGREGRMTEGEGETINTYRHNYLHFVKGTCTTVAFQ